MTKSIIFVSSILFLFVPSIAETAPLFPCTVTANANANTYIQTPSYAQYIPFDSALSFTDCTKTTAATIVVANPPQNPSPTAPVYMTLANSDSGPFTSSVLLVQGSTVITKANFPDWFSSSSTFTGLKLTTPGTPWVPSFISIVYY